MWLNRDLIKNKGIPFIEPQLKTDKIHSKPKNMPENLGHSWHSKVLKSLVPNNHDKYGMFKITIALGTCSSAPNSTCPVSHYAVWVVTCIVLLPLWYAKELWISSRWIEPSQCSRFKFWFIKVLCTELNNKIMNSEKTAQIYSCGNLILDKGRKCCKFESHLIMKTTIILENGNFKY